MRLGKNACLALLLAPLIVVIGTGAAVGSDSKLDLDIKDKFDVKMVELHASTVPVTPEMKERINKEVPPQSPPAMVKAPESGKSAIGPGYTIIPLPAYSYNRNEGSWIGALTPIFHANDKGEVEDIYAPLYLHNSLIGETFTMNYFGYRNRTTQYHAIASYATHIEHTLDFEYSNIKALDGRYIVDIVANSGKSAFNRFFGTNNSPASAESQYTMGDSNFSLMGGVHLTDDLSILARERYRVVSLENGPAKNLPQLLENNRSLPGIDAPDVLGHSLTLSYDTRDNQLTPLTGVYATVFGEYNQDIEFSDRNRWWRLTTQGRYFLPHDDYQAVFVVHAMIDVVTGQDKNQTQSVPGSSLLIRRGVPFYERPTLGGETTLRGFGRGRFTDDTAYLVNLEERYTLAHKSIMGNLIELEIAPFIDMGRVSTSLSSNDIIKAAQVNPGVGLRVLARPNVTGRLDVGYGRDGTNVFVGLDYPF